MKELINFLKRSCNWLESDAFTAFLANPPRLPDYDESARARTVIITIDVSPSMEDCDYHPTRLEGAKRAVSRYLATMAHYEPQTLIGIVDFHGEAKPVSHPLPIGEQRRELGQALKRLHTGCCTNIGAGLQLASRELALVPSPSDPTVILLTDGDSNQGPSPLRVANDLKAQNIQLDIIGIGGSPAEVNERQLRRMASVVNGQLRYWFIESADALVQRFEALALREIK
jgi:Mg-chelatase subunit ChlD